MQEQPVEFLVGRLLRQHRLRLGIAESCTGGLLGHRLTNVPGSSDYFIGGVISYANEVKSGILGVRSETLEQYGAVSRQTALEMARGIRAVLNVDIGLAITGIAGPGGATPGKPVGLTWIGLSVPQWEDAWRYLWSGDRLAVKQQSAEQALHLLAEYLASLEKPRGEEAFPSQGEIARPVHVEVHARFNLVGQAIPISFTWQGVTYPVESLGRRWKDGQGEHILVMVPGGKVFELIYSQTNGWLLVPSAASPSLA